MSRMTKYLRQKCTYEKLGRSLDGEVFLDKFAEPQYELSTIIKCRRETFVQEIQTNTGVILKSSTRYFVDNKQTIQANDKLDGKPVLKVQEYVNQFGILEGFECYV